MGLFGRKQNESDKPNPQLDAVLERLSALSLPQLAAEVMTEDLKRSGRVPEGAGNLAGRKVVDEISSQSLVHALLGVIRLEKELATVA